jgi:hypothetical protein
MVPVASLMRRYARFIYTDICRSGGSIRRMTLKVYIPAGLGSFYQMLIPPAYVRNQTIY